MPSYPHVVAPTASTTTSVGTTRRRYRRLLAEQLGRWIETSVSMTATANEPDRVVLVDEIRDDDMGSPFGWPSDTWLYARDGAQADTQRRVLSQPDVGWQGPAGAVVLARPFDAALIGGTAIEVTSPLPCGDSNGIKGLNTLVDEGLRCCRVPVLLTFAGNGGYAYSLEDYPWLFADGQTGGLYDAAYLIVSDPPMRNPSSTYRIESNGVTRRLITEGRSYAADETFFIEAFVNADRFVMDSATGIWDYPTTPGLAGDLWQAAAPEHWVLAFGMVRALDVLTRTVRRRRDLSREEKAEWMAEILESRRVWYRAARRIQIYELPRPMPARFEPMVGIGTMYDWNWM
jgi:hypothetical protein